MRPPFYKKRVGRNQTRRFQSAGQQHQAGVTRGVKPGARKCRNCMQPAHNAATCKQPKQPAQGTPVDFSSVFGSVSAPYM
jgi:hypothetical protein